MQIKFQEGVTVHYQELGNTLKVSLSELDSTCGAECVWLFRVLNCDSEVPAITELAFDLVSEITCAHYQTPYPLALQLPNQQFKKRAISDWSQGFWR
jgi:hypothetical protein